MGTPQGPEYLAITADQLPTLLTGAGEQGLEAGHTVGLLLPKYVLPAKERVLAVVAVKALRHLGPGCLSPAREESRKGSSEHAHGTTVPLHHGHLEHHLHRGWLVSWVSNRHSPLTRLVIFSFKKNYLGAVLCLMHSTCLEVLVLGDRVRKSDLDVGHKTRVGARTLVPQEECLPQTGWNCTSHLPHLLPPE